MSTMTVERASELVKASLGNTKIDLFCHFEQHLNPHPPKLNGQWNDAYMNWQQMFAEMCGFLIATNVRTQQGQRQ